VAAGGINKTNMTYKGKAIYNPSGKAGEYSYWACNFYVGCSNGCSYCYCKKGLLASTMGGNKPILKRGFKDEEHALEIFEKELKYNLIELRKHGLFFSFTTDPMLPQTRSLTMDALIMCWINNVPVKILTKVAFNTDQFIAFFEPLRSDFKQKVMIGFTLTGHDELEPGASTNAERIEAMKKLHKAGFKTFASIEPIIDLQSSFNMILDSRGFCDLNKIGLMSGKKYDRDELRRFIDNAMIICETWNAKIYFKDSLLKAAGIERESLPELCVGRDYNLFKI